LEDIAKSCIRHDKVTVMRARLSDVATQAGVSEATVSRVLNGRPGVSANARKSVLTALDVLGYERPPQLRARATGLVGLIVPELHNPVFPAFVQVIESELTQFGFTPVLCTQAPGGITEDEYVEDLLDRGVSGIVFVSGLHADTSSDPDRYQSLLARRLPIVLVNGYLPGVDAPAISADDSTAAELAVGHLAALGHRRIGLVAGPRRFTPVQRKIDGFHRAVGKLVDSDQAGESGDLIELSLFSVEGGALSAKRLLAKGATAMVCASDLMALGAIQAVRDAGRSVPGQVSVVGYDDSTLMAFTDPPLTTVRQPVHAMGLAAVRALVDQIKGEPVPNAEFLFRPELVVRGSTGPA
jgi:alanine racemase